ncbi:LodA/GoxA family CTQ-dependent oxidase, partial [Flavobacterium sp. J27]|uniref:LodA/GoxA family CTQ-dependent oxidase n=1 Tax=Flavobacterium sp. J27 TaxID=2060419 RepID=UPI00197AE27B
MSKSYTTFKIHPSIGIARLGNSDQFYIAPEQPGALPIVCDASGKEKQDTNGNPVRVSSFKDDNDLSKIKKQAARFRVFAYADEGDSEGKEIQVGGKYNFIYQTAVTAPRIVEGTVTDIDWTVHLANKKASWYEFQET